MAKLNKQIRDVTIEGTMNALCVSAKDLAQLRGTVSEKKRIELAINIEINAALMPVKWISFPQKLVEWMNTRNASALH